MAEAKVHWVRSNGFVLGLGLAVVVAFLVPGPGSRDGLLHPEILNNVGVALILFLQGLSLPFEKIRNSLGQWRLHLVIQGFTFVLFPLVGLLLDALLPRLWTSEPMAIRSGFLYLCVLPSVVSTSVVFTTTAGGNTAGALFNAAFSNLLGVFATPVLVHWLMQSAGHGAMPPFGPLLLKITLLTLIPFSLGAALRPRLREWFDPRKAWAARISNAVILCIVYTAFCDSVAERIWSKYSSLLTVQIIAVVIALFAGISFLAWGLCKALRFDRADTIAAYFCSVKKTLAMGVPLAALIFGARPDLSLILLPIMLYHPLQLIVNGILANQLSKGARS
ncbi:solute carrier family 10 (sodium/bile acid cotransporter), member 7 [Verrucomicrobium sp. GAS474]|uniref:bile acid:sodium symporter family protein n=1 Tax=Verrucomicrobium sp. GAS474 TaxID=1882831 RepID=UPI00087A81F0|nr:bile acid:sodium symporter family protein [Verrucomicrobium sp. GAS474]SDT86242.1 solute carrier family 10 (sodium/bile acid cotransporter), member 7 [Verrucomicrobium sp. GAS474]